MTKTTPPQERSRRWARQQGPRRPGILGSLLVDAGSIDGDTLERALALQAGSGRRIGFVLRQMGAVDDAEVGRALAGQLGLDFMEGPLEPDTAALDAVRPELRAGRRVVPLALTDRAIRVAMADPLDLEAMDDVRFQTGRRVEPVVTTESAVDRFLEQGRPGAATARSIGGTGGEVLSDLISELPSSEGTTRLDDRDALEAAASSAPVVRLVDHVLARAVDAEASDIHLEAGTGAVRIRFRTDGLLRTFADLPVSCHAPAISRLKIMAGLDIAVKRRPQDGSFGFSHGGSDLTARLSTLPSAAGEKAVLRILDPSKAPEGVSGLGLSPEDLVQIRSLLRMRQGVVLAAGPTGSGKSSTLFGALAEIDRNVMNVVTLEDPVEYRLDGVTQVQVDARSGLSFPAALRSVLRQDPDVVMIGEIRDRETAEIAMAAAVTGHLVLSTVHTTDAPGALTRLVNMGVPPFLVAGGLTGVVAQRLVRRLCSRCLGRDPDCDRCHDGYRGRIGIFQVLSMTDPLRDAVVRRAPRTDLRRLAREAGMGTLVEDGRRKVAEGLTSPQEVARVVSDPSGAVRPCRRCAADLPTGSNGCPRCGTQHRRHCPCGRELEASWRFCPACLRPC